MDRVEKALILIDHGSFGLEIGPSHNPLAPKKAGFNVEILDHATADELRQKYQEHNLNLDNIEEVDYVWRGEPLDELIGKTESYDYIIASHVIEHTTDIIGFLQQCAKLLKPTGVLSLIIPDKRYCFDYLRPISTTGDCIQAHFEKRSRHSIGVVFDYFSSVCRLNNNGAWGKDALQGELQLIHSLDDARHYMELAKDISAEYIDVHQWMFTPSSFKLILEDLYEAISFDTVGCEFYITLSKQIVPQSERIELYKIILQELAAKNVS